APRHLAWHLRDLEVRDRRRGDQLPVAALERLVDALPEQLRRALPAGVPQLAAHLRVRVVVHELDDPAPGLDLALLPQPRTAGSDPPVRGNAEHLAHHEPRAAERPGPELHE